MSLALCYAQKGYPTVTVRLPAVLLLENAVKPDVATVAGEGNLARLDSRKNGTAVLLGVGTFAVTAAADVRRKLAKRAGKILYTEEIKTLKIQCGKSRRIRQVAAFRIV